jgi:DNA-binding transcriptional LysR family regulator
MTVPTPRLARRPLRSGPPAGLELRSDRLAVLVAVAEAGGVSRAARQLGRSQSSVSQVIAALELDVGGPLFVRAGRQAVLTDEGQLLVDQARQVLAALAGARDALQARRNVTEGTLRLGTSDTLATYLLPPVLAALRSRYPRVELRLENRPSPVIAGAVARRELDVGVVSLPLPTRLEPGAQALTQIPLQRQPDVVIVPPGHPLARRARLRPVDLAPWPLLLLDRSTSLRDWLDRHLAAAGVRPRIELEVGSVEVLKRLVERGFGVSVVPALAVDRRDRLVAVPLAGLSGNRWVGLVVGPAPSRATTAFVALARTLLGARH